jgi:hypothetical protein
LNATPPRLSIGPEGKSRRTACEPFAFTGALTPVIGVHNLTSFGENVMTIPIAPSSPSRAFQRMQLGLFLGALACVPSAARAQVSFSGLQTTIGSGFSQPGGVAVDGSGNVFFADTVNNSV